VVDANEGRLEIRSPTKIYGHLYFTLVILVASSAPVLAMEVGISGLSGDVNW
jgi:hypothetical protein